MTEHRVGTREEWLAARKGLLEREDGLYHTYSRHAPGGDLLAPYYYQLLDQVPKGRGDGFRAVRHDEYPNE